MAKQKKLMQSGGGALAIDQTDQLLIEFSLFVNAYLQSKEHLRSDHLLDAYTYILDALNHWARIVILEEGKNIESSVWEQVYHVNIGVYKLYEEVALSRETIQQRIQLVLLACDFSVMSKLEKCCSALIRFLQKQERPFALHELEQSEEFAIVSDQLPVLLKMLVKKGLIREVAVAGSDDIDKLEIKYTVPDIPMNPMNQMSSVVEM